MNALVWFLLVLTFAFDGLAVYFSLRARRHVREVERWMERAGRHPSSWSD